MSEHDHLWQDAARQAGGERLVDLLRDMQATQNALLDRMNDLESTVKQHIGAAFPGGDPDGHRRAHEAMMERTEEIRRLRAAIMEKSLSGIVWSAMIAIGYSLWHWLIQQLKNG